jgi:hypothetical protein
MCDQDREEDRAGSGTAGRCQLAASSRPAESGGELGAVSAGSLAVGHHAGGSNPNAGLSFIRFRTASDGEVVGHHAGGSNPSAASTGAASLGGGPALMEVWGWRSE